MAETSFHRCRFWRLNIACFIFNFFMVLLLSKNQSECSNASVCNKAMPLYTACNENRMFFHYLAPWAFILNKMHHIQKPMKQTMLEMRNCHYNAMQRALWQLKSISFPCLIGCDTECVDMLGRFVQFLFYHSWICP